MISPWSSRGGGVSGVGGEGCSGWAAGLVRVGAGVAAIVVDVLGGLPRMGFAIALCMFMGFMISVSFHDVPVGRLGPAGDTS